MREDKEFQEFRDLMKRSETFEEGINKGTVLMGLFVGLIMAPASVFMNLVAGLHMGGAAKWVTVLLYVEVARRAFKKLKRPEIFILFYMCGAAISAGGEEWLMRQFLVQSEELRKMGMIELIPTWYAPTDPEVLKDRNFFMPQWLLPIGITIFMMVVTRIDDFGLGYVLFRLTADVEELPFPMAPVGAAGMTALADASDDKETWRYRIFAAGAALGLMFGAVYIGLPAVTGELFGDIIRIFPIPFVDLTHYTENILPAMPIMLSFDLGLVITGMVMPFWAIMGSLFGVIFTMILNPILQKTGYLPSWDEGLGAMEILRGNTFDFYYSFNFGLLFAVALIGFIHMYNNFQKKKREANEMGKPAIKWAKLFEAPKGRGDFSIFIGLLIYVLSTGCYIGMAYYLVNHASGPLLGEEFPLWLLLVYGFVWTPFISYIGARMEGIVGQQMKIPFVKESTFILSGYKGAAIWFAPIPLQNHTGQVLEFRQMELIGAKFSGMIKADLITFPIVVIGTLGFAQFIWSMGPVPSQSYPHAMEFWELEAFNKGLTWSATMPGEMVSPFRESFRPEYIATGFGLALGFYALLSHFNLPVFLVYGMIRGLDQSLPHTILPTIAGALIGRYFCRKWFGDKWPQYRVVFAAGFSAGMGLIGMFALGVVFMSKSANTLPI